MRTNTHTRTHAQLQRCDTRLNSVDTHTNARTHERTHTQTRARTQVYGVLPAATAFMVYYSKISNIFSKNMLFYVTALPFLVS